MGAVICVIEDEEVIAGAVAARLRAEGFDVEVAGDGPAGVALCERVRPDLVVLDEDALVGLSADAVPAFRAQQVGCLSGEVRDELAEPDGLAGFNLARSRARELLRQRAPCH